MASIKNVAEAFFAACEAGKGWEVCSAYCTPNEERKGDIPNFLPTP
jgi:hypothetical protein